eukprot:359303-Chlamydomonas_euryale.AAC.9
MDAKTLHGDCLLSKQIHCRGRVDTTGVGMGHLTGEVKRLMTLVTKYDQDNYPEMLGHICIINAPAIFRMLWSFAKNLIDIRTQNKIEVGGVL